MAAHDGLKASLKAHNDSFDSLLKTIPAQYYLSDSKMNSQASLTPQPSRKEKRAAMSDELRDAAKLKKAKKYDPDEPKTIQELQAARAAKEEQSSEVDDDDDEQDSPNEQGFADSDLEDAEPVDSDGLRKNADFVPISNNALTPSELKAKFEAKKKSLKRKTSSRESDADDSDDDDDQERKRRAQLRENRRKRTKETIKAEKRQARTANPKSGPSTSTGESGNKRKGGIDSGAAVSKPPQKTTVDLVHAPVNGASSALTHPPPSTIVPSTSTNPADYDFSNLKFGSSKALDGIDKQRKSKHDLPKDANKALAIVQARKDRLEKLEPEQRERKEEKDLWEKAALKAGGEKVRDDEKRLKKMAKRQEREKQKSSKAWAERKSKLAENQSAKQAKRQQNIQARIQAIKDKKAHHKKGSSSGGKTVSKSHGHSKAKSKGKARPGFEGRK